MKHLLTPLLLFIVCQFSFAQIRQAESEIQNIMNKYDVVGLSVAVVKKGDLVYHHSFGLNDIMAQTPLVDSSLFRIASISKSFSATAIMQLVEAKKLSLSDDISKLVGFKVRNPNFPSTVITLKMLLSHTSSLNDSQGYFTFDVLNPEKNANWAKCFSAYEPGKGYKYCNLNFNMIGAVIENASGERFDQYIKHHILDPLGLYGGYAVDSLDARKFVTLYDYDTVKKSFTPSPAAYNPRSEEIKKYVMGYSTPIFSPTGGMKISAIDLAKYMTMHMNKGKYKDKKIISKKSAKLMQTPISAEEHYGLALQQTSKLIPGKNLTGHTGSAYGLYSSMFFDPKEKFGIVVITNGCNPIYNDGNVAAIAATVNALYKNIVALPSP
jgi:CubicO group peptidase (beta-lactamase class C family)